MKKELQDRLGDALAKAQYNESHFGWNSEEAREAWWVVDQIENEIQRQWEFAHEDWP